MKEKIFDLIASIKPYDEMEQKHLQNISNRLASDEEALPLIAPRNSPKRLLSRFVFFDIDESKILLLNQRKSDLWLPLEGCLHLKKDFAATIKRAVLEKLRMETDLLFPSPVFLSQRKTGSLTENHIDISLWYILKGCSNTPLEFDKGEFSEIRWFAPNEIPFKKSDPHMQRFIDKLSNRKEDDKKWLDAKYLKKGTKTQRELWKILKKTNILHLLNKYNPVLIGTIPIDIDIKGSDVDIACETYDFASFIEDLKGLFPTIAIKKKKRAVIGRIKIDPFDFEIYGEAKPVHQQNGFVHMVVEAQLLSLGGNKMRQKIRNLKSSGIKTEPAFAKYLAIQGDPYQKILSISKFTEKIR